MPFLKAEGIIISYDETEEPISIEFLNASQRQLESVC